MANDCNKSAEVNGGTPFAEATGSATERVPQYDVELRLADEAVREWMAMAARLKSVVGCRATEKRRAAAEMAYDNLLRKYEKPWLKGVLADAVKAKQQWPEWAKSPNVEVRHGGPDDSK